MTGRNGLRRHTVDFVFVLALFCVLAASSLMIALIGANLYRRTAANMQENFDRRTSLLYITQKVRQSDSASAVRLDELEGQDALVLTQWVGGAAYETWIYCQEGKLREQLVAAGQPQQGAAGQPIMDLGSLELAWAGEGLLRVSTVSAEGASQQMLLGIRSDGIQ